MPPAVVEASPYDFLNPELVKFMNKMRFVWEKPLVSSSVLRCAHHPAEMKKKAPGAHRAGTAVDFAQPHDPAETIRLINRITSILLLDHPNAMGFAWKASKGKRRGFIHCDVGHPRVARPMVWGY